MLEFKIRLNNNMPLIDDLLLVLEDAGYGAALEAKPLLDGRNDLFLFFHRDGDIKATYDKEEFEKRNCLELTVQSAFIAVKLDKKNFEDANHYVKRGTYVIHILRAAYDKKTEWYYYKGIKGEDGHWEPFHYNDYEFCKKFFGPKFTYNCLVGYKSDDIRKPNKTISRIKLNAKSKPFRPRTRYSGVVW